MILIDDFKTFSFSIIIEFLSYRQFLCCLNFCNRKTTFQKETFIKVLSLLPSLLALLPSLSRPKLLSLPMLSSSSSTLTSSEHKCSKLFDIAANIFVRLKKSQANFVTSFAAHSFFFSTLVTFRFTGNHF